ncbi:MAG: hypothetical protein H6661_04480 [Ardenticatenaceae bacterium]|nr:hypothetical protein [Ardenticatenaceae bacterium]
MNQKLQQAYVMRGDNKSAVSSDPDIAKIRMKTQAWYLLSLLVDSEEKRHVPELCAGPWSRLYYEKPRRG